MEKITGIFFVFRPHYEVETKEEKNSKTRNTFLLLLLLLQ